MSSEVRSSVRTTVRWALACALVAGLLRPGAVEAQYDQAPPPSAWALQGVTVVHGDGRMDEDVTLVIRHGVIERMEVGGDAPADARRIGRENGPLYVYPGIVDGEGGAPVETPQPDRDGVEAWDPGREVQHLTPQRRAYEFLAEHEESLAAERRAGVVASAVYPGRGVAPGQPSLILHDPQARAPRETALEPSLGLAMSFDGARGAYPSTLMAVHAFIRQRFLDAEHHAEQRAAFVSGADGVQAVTRDPDLEFLAEAAAGDQRVFFRTAGAENVRRVLALADEIGFRPIIVGGEGIGELAEELARREVSVLLSGDLPSPDDWDPDSDEALTPAGARERDRLLRIYRTAAELHEAGVPFAITSGGEGGGTSLDGARRFVEHGLAPETALAALTTAPAGLLGMPGLNRIAQGATANLLVADGELLDEDTGVVWTFVNGQAEKGQAVRDGDAASEDLDADALTGRWEGEVEVGGGTQPLTVEITEGPDGLEGRVRSAQGEWTDLRSVEMDAATITMEMPVPQMDATSVLRGTLEGDEISGTGSVSSPQGEFEFAFRLRRVPEGGER